MEEEQTVNCNHHLDCLIEKLEGELIVSDYAGY